MTVLRDRKVALVWSGSVVSSIGTGAMFVAMPYYTYVHSGSVVATAVVTLAEYAPAVGVAQLAGLLVDRWDARSVLIVANIALAACTLAYLLHDAWWWFAVVAFVRSCGAQFVVPGMNTLVPAVAPPDRLAEVNGVNAIGHNIARLAGPALGGLLVGRGGLGLVAVVDAITFLVAAALIAAVRSSRHPRATPAGGLLSMWRSGWSSVRHHQVLWALTWIMALVGFGEGFVSALLAPWMVDIAGGNSAQLGLMLSLQALGGLAGGFIVVRCARRRDSLTMLCVGAFASCGLLLVLFNYPLVAPVGPGPAIVLTALGGLPFAVYGTAQGISVQAHASDGFRGRVVSITFGAQGIAQLIGIGVAGPVAHLFGPLTINVDALGYLAAAAIGYVTIRRVRGDGLGRP